MRYSTAFFLDPLFILRVNGALCPRVLFINQTVASIIQIYSVIKLKCFGHLLCPSSGVFYCTFVIGKFHAGLMTASK